VIETSARLLKLLSLLQGRRVWSGADLAGRLAVDVRTIRRDVGKLRRLGYPIHAGPGTTGGYRLGAGAALPPLLLDDDEAVAVALGLRTAAGGTVAGMAETSVRALAKLEQVLPARLRHRVDALQSMVVPVAAGGPTVDPGALTVIAAACRDHDRLRFDYRDHDGTPSIRSVEPHRLVHTGRRWYLLAWDTDRADWRMFRVDRLVPRTPAGPRFTPREPPAADLAAYTSYGISTGTYRYRATVTVAAPAPAVVERVPPTAGLVEACGPASCRLQVGANDLNLLAIHVGLLGFEFRVDDPPELAGHLRRLADRIIRAVGQ
jgi:predicted DNA-binding transcriptional regulator YafY